MLIIHLQARSNHKRRHKPYNQHKNTNGILSPVGRVRHYLLHVEQSLAENGDDDHEE